MIPTIIFIVVVVAYLILRGTVLKSKNADSVRPPQESKPSVEMPNDKLAIVNNINYDQLKRVVTDFCYMYNEKSFEVLPRIYKISPDEFAITFPFDAQFHIFCFFVNYMKYPIDVEWDADVLAWMTCKESDFHSGTEIVGKQIMIFVSESIKEADSVNITTSDNKAYMYSFSTDEPKRLSVFEKNYISPKNDFNIKENKNFENFS